MVAHDMRSPIMAAQVSVATIEQFFAAALPSQAGRWCAEVTAACQNVLDFVNQFLTIETLESGGVVLSPSDFVLGDLIDECFEAMASHGEAKSLSFKNRCRDIKVRADRERIKQVVTGLLANAIGAASNQSLVSISSRAQSNDFEIVSVKDDGQPLTKVQRRRIFDKFVQGRGADLDGPSGPGLFVCKMLIQCHGCKVGAESRERGGREFWFSLPRDTQALVPANAQPEPNFAGGFTGQRLGLAGYVRHGLIGKILLLVAIPVIVQGAWLIWIAGQLAKSQALEEAVQQQGDIVAGMHSFLLRGYRAKTNAVFYAVFKDQLYKKQAIEEVQALRRVAADVFSETTKAFLASDLWQEGSELAESQAKQMQGQIAEASSGDVELALAHSTSGIGSAFALNQKLEKLIDRQSLVLAAVSSENEKLRLQVQGLILWAVVLNICLSSLQWWAFRFDITRRMNMLIENARKIPGREALHDKMTGGDEIAVLDKLLHEAASELADCDAQRSEVMRVISQNISAPCKWWPRNSPTLTLRHCPWLCVAMARQILKRPGET